MRSCYKFGIKMLPNSPENRTGPDYCSLAPSVGVHKGGLVYSPWGYPWEFLVGVCRPVHKIQTIFQTKKCNFPHPFSDQTSKIHSRFQTWPEIMLSLLTECKQNNSSNPFRIRIPFFLSYSFGIETIKTFIQSRSSLKNHTRFQTKIGKVYTRFQTKTGQKPYPMGRHKPI